MTRHAIESSDSAEIAARLRLRAQCSVRLHRPCLSLQLWALLDGAVLHCVHSLNKTPATQRAETRAVAERGCRDG